MDEPTRSELERIFRTFESNVEEARRKAEEREQQIERFHVEYDRVKKEVITPTMKEVGTYIQKLGHNYRIDEFEKEKGKISMVIIPNTGKRINLDEPTISFEGWDTDISISKRPLHTSNSSNERVKIEDITRSFVEQNILDVIQKWERMKEGEHKRYG